MVRIHRRSFPDFFMTGLGERFLTIYYGVVIDAPEGILLLAREGGRTIGFVSGAADARSFYRKLRARSLALAIAASPAVLRQPRLIARLIRNALQMLRLARKDLPSDRPGCELSSIAVDPDAAGKGVGKRLMCAFRDSACAAGASGLYLTTDASENAAVNAFYRSVGLTHSRSFRASGDRMMNEYVWSFEGSE